MKTRNFLAIALAAAATAYLLVEAIPGILIHAVKSQTESMFPEPVVELASEAIPPGPIEIEAISPMPEDPWKPVKITTYGPGYHGQGTNSGEIFDDNALTAAAPVVRVNGRVPKGRHRPSIPYGTMIEVRWRSRTVVVKINDTCVGGTLDLSKAAMTQLLGRYENTTVRGEWRKLD